MRGLVWIRRDLRAHDHVALYQAAQECDELMIIFVFDKNILEKLPADDLRVYFIYQTLQALKGKIEISTYYGDPVDIVPKIVSEKKIDCVYSNRDYEDYAIKRDNKVRKMIAPIAFKQFKDQVIFEAKEVRTGSGGAYKVFTPYKRKWLQLLNEREESLYDFTPKLNKVKVLKGNKFISLKEMGFEKPSSPYPLIDNKKLLTSWKKHIAQYDQARDVPAQSGTSRMSPYLRFGLVSARELLRYYKEKSKGQEVWISEIIWRDFYSNILQEYPRVEKTAFKDKYRAVKWPGNDKLFKAWCEGRTGFPIVDAGMRELNQTGWMHNRVRMITAAFLTKLCLVDWRKGEAYFAKKLIDFDLASNSGGWQWSASTGTDAVPYFRIFNPESQTKKFDPDFEYIKKFVPEWGSDSYPEPIIDYKKARDKALLFYKEIENAN
jgi:deoxyribodipyrimidine photo-lyase